MGADRTSVKNVGNRIPGPIQGGRSGWERPQSAGCLYIGNGTRQNCVGFLEIRPKQRRTKMKIGRGVSPLRRSWSTFKWMLSCALVCSAHKRAEHNKDRQPLYHLIKHPPLEVSKFTQGIKSCCSLFMSAGLSRIVDGSLSLHHSCFGYDGRHRRPLGNTCKKRNPQ